MATPDLSVILADAQKGLSAILTILETLSGTKAATPASGSTAGTSASSSATAVTVEGGIITDVTAVAGAIEAGEKLATVTETAANTPAMVQSVEVQRKQDQLDRFNAALQTHDSDAIERALAAL